MTRVRRGLGEQGPTDRRAAVKSGQTNCFGVLLVLDFRVKGGRGVQQVRIGPPACYWTPVGYDGGLISRGH